MMSRALKKFDDNPGHAHRHHLAGEAALAQGAPAAAAVVDDHGRHRPLAGGPVDLGAELDRLAPVAALEGNRLALLCERARRDGLDDARGEERREHAQALAHQAATGRQSLGQQACAVRKDERQHQCEC